MHHIHHTEAIVLGGFPRAEADKLIYLYTRDFGLVRAQARGIRKLSSKLRFALQPYMTVQVDLIPMRAGWRAGSTDLVESLDTPPMLVLGVLHRITDLVRRLVPEEEKNEALYEAIIEVMKFLSKIVKENGDTNKAANLPDMASLELLAVMRILYHLGYVTDGRSSDILTAAITLELLGQVAANREALVKEVNQSLRETML